MDDGGVVDFDKLAKSLTHGKNEYNLSGSVIHFASCSVMRWPKCVEEFRKEVGASCVSGYSRSVGYELSWAFELMYLDLLAKRNVNAGTLNTLFRRVKEKPEYSGLAQKLGFRMTF